MFISSVVILPPVIFPIVALSIVWAMAELTTVTPAIATLAAPARMATTANNVILLINVIDGWPSI